MAVNPTFSESEAVLKARCRLTSVKNPDATAIFESAVQMGYTRFVRALGIARVSLIASYALVATPATNEQFLRMLGAQTEEKIVLQELRRRLPTMFLDASGSALREWNEAPESPSRGNPGEAEIRRLETEIVEALALLQGEESAGEERGIKAETFGPSEDAPAPGLHDRVWGAS